MKAVVMHMLADTKGSSNVSAKSSKAANDIFKILCKLGAESIPRVAVHAALSIGALCMVVFSSAHGVICASSSLLMKWLFQDEHEHQQWPAVISLGLISNCFHATDRKNKVEVIGGLLKI
ncbi:protein RST1 isoform X1 [Iris pallida]|uniref:Protein RST1 isoform X1 n=1 Tax=Iris pallida TaxID=29817 RepID=A0AAX6I4Z2_IRIPA|nr:protein RST1 isoform X1 [Iris pallida]